MRSQAVCILLIFASILPGCRGRQPAAVKEKPGNVQSKDSTYLFNGRTLDGWEITNFGTQGPVYVSDDEIILGMGDGCTGITWKGKFPVADYEVTLEAKKVDGNDFFCGMTFPAGEYPCTLIIGGWGGTVVGLSSINGLDASENETTINRSFTKDRWYKISLRVTHSGIEARIDDEIVIDFTIGDNILSIRPEVDLSRPFGIASWRTTAALRNIRLIPFNGNN